MCKLTNIIIVIFLIILIMKLFNYYNKERFTGLEHLTLQSDEAIQNLASLYNQDNLTVGSLNVTRDIRAGSIPIVNSTTGTINNLKTDKLQTDKLQLGNKWLLSGNGDGYGNDDWLRFLKTDGSSGYYGGIATGKLFVLTDSNGNNTFDGDVGKALNTLNNRANNLQNYYRTRENVRCADGWDLTNSFQVSNIDDCANQCRSRFPDNGLCATFRKNDSQCFCKSISALTGNDTNFQAKMIG